MQYTHWKPHEHEGEGDLYVRSNLATDYKFAERVLDERTILLPQTMKDSIDETRSVLHGVWFYTEGRHWWLITCWIVELIVVVYLLIVLTYEAVMYCPLDHGVNPFCEKCYDTEFLVFGYTWALFWLGNLWAYVLLISRGFTWKVKELNSVAETNRRKGVPGIAVYWWFITSAFNIIWLIVGIYVLVKSNDCLSEDTRSVHGHALRGKGLRSRTIFLSLLVSLILYVILFLIGRVGNWRGRGGKK